MTQVSSTTTPVGFAGEITALFLENEDNQTESARLERDAARAQYLQDAQAQVDSLNKAASAALTSAFVSSAFSMAAGACTVFGAVSQFNADTNAAGLAPGDVCPATVAMRKVVASETEVAKLWDAGSKTASALAEFTTAMGKSNADHDQADAKRSEIAANQAQWQANDANTDVDQANKHRDALLDTYQEIQHDRAAANTSIIGRI